MKESNKKTKGVHDYSFSCLSTPVNTWAILATENDESRHSEINNDMLSYSPKKILLKYWSLIKVYLFFNFSKQNIDGWAGKNQFMTRPKEWYCEWEELSVFLFFENLLLLIVSKTKIDVLLFISPCWLQSSLYNSSRRDGYCNTSPQHHNPLLVDLDWITLISVIIISTTSHLKSQILILNGQLTKFCWS